MRCEPVPAARAAGRAALEPGSSQLRLLIEALPAPAYACDRDGLITCYNRRALELWGRAPKLNDPEDRFCGSSRLYSPQGEPVAHDQGWVALALREERECSGREIVIERPDGRRLAALSHVTPLRDEAGRLLGALSVLVDVSRRKRAEDELREAKAQRDAQLQDLTRLHEMSVRLSTTRELQPMLSEILATAAAIDGARMGHLSLCDATFEHLEVGASLGFPLQILNLIRRVRLGGGACGAALEQRRRVVAEDVAADPLFASQREVAQLAGFRAVHCTPLMTRSGRVIGTLCTHFAEPRRPSEWAMHLLDLCARNAVDAIENARLYGELQESHQRKDEFLATLAHELRNPLAPIRNAVEILRSRPALEPAQAWSAEVIERQVGQLKRLVDDLLDLSRITTGKLELRLERIELGQVLVTALETSRPLIEAGGQDLVVSLPPQPVLVDADGVRLAQVVANLLNNAAKYTERGGRIWLTARREGSEAVVSVRDTGVGIDAETMPRIFEMFGQADRSLERSQGGLGIGLTLVSRLVRLHGGAISARSEGRGKGSEFVVRLRAAGDQPADGHGGEGAGRRRPPLRVLVVDDNQDAAASLRMLLQMKGHEVRVAHDGSEAVTAAGNYRPDVVLLDIGLPKLNGFEAARSIRRLLSGKRLLLIATTGWGQKTDRERSRQAGFDHHLVKPADPAMLLGLLDAFSEAKGPRPATAAAAGAGPAERWGSLPS